MKQRVKHLLLFLTYLSFLPLAPLFGDESLKVPSKKMGDQMDMKISPSEDSLYGCFGMNLEYLWMRSSNENLVYGCVRINDLKHGAAGNFVVKESMVRPKKYWKPGFRLSFDWNTPYDYWNVDAGWTYYYNKSITDAASPEEILLFLGTNQNDGIIPYWALPSQTTVTASSAGVTGFRVLFQNLQGIWRLNYNMLNLELSRSLHLTEALSFKPHFGVMSGWIHQDVTVLYERCFFSAGGGNVASLVNASNKFWGIGLTAGLDSSWSLGGGWSILSKMGANLMSGRTNTRTVQSGRTAQNEFLRQANSTDHVSQFSPGIEAAFGFQWGRYFSNNDLYLSFDALWESIYWWGQFDFILPERAITSSGSPSVSSSYQPVMPESNKGLKIEGLSLKMNLSF